LGEKNVNEAETTRTIQFLKNRSRW